MDGLRIEIPRDYLCGGCSSKPGHFYLDAEKL